MKDGLSTRWRSASSASSLRQHASWTAGRTSQSATASAGRRSTWTAITRPLLTLAGRQTQPDAPELAAVAFPGLAMNKLPTLGQRRDPPRDDYPNVEAKLKNLAATLLTIRRNAGRRRGRLSRLLAGNRKRLRSRRRGCLGPLLPGGLDPRRSGRGWFPAARAPPDRPPASRPASNAGAVGRPAWLRAGRPRPSGRRRRFMRPGILPDPGLRFHRRSRARPTVPPSGCAMANPNFGPQGRGRPGGRRKEGVDREGVVRCSREGDDAAGPVLLRGGPRRPGRSASSHGQRPDRDPKEPKPARPADPS